MVQEKNLAGMVLNPSAGKEISLKNMRDFCKLPILFYFYLKDQVGVTKEVIFHPVRKDGLNGQPHRGFVFHHPEMGELLCYILHRTEDWFDVNVAFNKKSESGETTLNGGLLFSISFWSIKGIANETENRAYFNIPSGFEGAITDDKYQTLIDTLRKSYNFKLEMLKMLEDCKK